MRNADLGALLSVAELAALGEVWETDFERSKASAFSSTIEERSHLRFDGLS
jgi:hypothetical protein